MKKRKNKKMAKRTLKKIRLIKRYGSKKLFLMLAGVFAAIGIGTLIYSQARPANLVNQTGNTVVTNAQVVAFLQEACGEDYEEAEDCLGKNLLTNSSFESAVEPYNSSGSLGAPTKCAKVEPDSGVRTENNNLGKWYMSGINTAFRGQSSGAYEGKYVARTAGIADLSKDTNPGSPNIGVLCQWVAIPDGVNEYATFVRAWLRRVCSAYQEEQCGTIQMWICFANAQGNIPDGWCVYTNIPSSGISETSYSYLTGPAMTQPSGAKFARFWISVPWGKSCAGYDPAGSCWGAGYDIYWDNAALILKEAN